jgi:hypothetical protein
MRIERVDVAGGFWLDQVGGVAVEFRRGGMAAKGTAGD